VGCHAGPPEGRHPVTPAPPITCLVDSRRGGIGTVGDRQGEQQQRDRPPWFLRFRDQAPSVVPASSQRPHKEGGKTPSDTIRPRRRPAPPSPRVAWIPIRRHDRTSTPTSMRASPQPQPAPTSRSRAAAALPTAAARRPPSGPATPRRPASGSAPVTSDARRGGHSARGPPPASVSPRPHSTQSLSPASAVGGQTCGRIVGLSWGNGWMVGGWRVPTPLRSGLRADQVGSNAVTRGGGWMESAW
jgi:hypothetical protein